LQQGPWEDCLLCNVVPGGRAAAVRPNSSQPPAGAGRARAGEGPWVPRGRFRGLDGVGRKPARGGAGGQARWPRLPAVLAWWGSAGRMGTPASFGGCKRRALGALGGVGRCREGLAAVFALGAGGLLGWPREDRCAGEKRTAAPIWVAGRRGAALPTRRASPQA
jgi:hypothetical protein